MNNQWSKELMHHGIQGMHWGERNGPPYPLDPKMSKEIQGTPKTQLTREQMLAIKNLKKARTANLDKFGKTPETNTLFIAGYSGSGKSTTALGIARKNDHVIHLDAYSEPGAKTTDVGSRATFITNRKFNKLLDKECPRWQEMANAESDPKDGGMKRHGNEYWKTVDQFRDAIEKFAKQEFKKGNRVIVEGVQLADEWLAPKSYYDGKPVVTLGTNQLKAMRQAAERDGIGNGYIGVIKRLKGMDKQSRKEYLDWYLKWSPKNLDDLVTKAGTIEKGKKYISELIG